MCSTGMVHNSILANGIHGLPLDGIMVMMKMMRCVLEIGMQLKKF